MTADATTRVSDLPESAARTTAATEDRQTAVVVKCAETVTTDATTEGPKEGPAAATTAPAETVVTTAHAGTDATTESNAAEAPSRNEAVTKKRDQDRPTAGATTAIQVINKNKSRPPPSLSDAFPILCALTFVFVGSPRREDPEKGSNDHYDKEHRNDEREIAHENGNHDE